MWRNVFAIMQAVDPIFDVDRDGNLEVPVWPISPPEEKALGEASEECLKALPKTQRAALAKAMNKYMPFIGLGIALSQVAGPRVAHSIEYKKVLKARQQREQTLAAERSRNAEASYPSGGSTRGTDATPYPDVATAPGAAKSNGAAVAFTIGGES